MPGVQFANVNWEHEEAKAIHGHHRRQEKRQRRHENRMKHRQEIEDGNTFLSFLFEFHNDRLRLLLEENVDGLTFLKMKYESSLYCDSDLMDIFLKRDMRAEELTRSELVILLDWRQALIMEGTFYDKSMEFESREDDNGESRRQ